MTDARRDLRSCFVVLVAKIQEEKTGCRDKSGEHPKADGHFMSGDGNDGFSLKMGVM